MKIFDYFTPNVRIGVTYSLGLVLLIYGIFFLKKTDIFKNTYLLNAQFNTANGLSVGDPVVVNGLKVGKVNDLSIDKQVVLAQFEIAKNIKLPKDSRADIVGQSLLGGKVIEITWGTDEKHFHYGDTIATGHVADFTKKLAHYSDSILSKIVPIEEKITVLLDKLNTTVDVALGSLQTVQRVLNKNEEPIHQIALNLQQILAHTKQSTLPLIDASLVQVRDFGTQLNAQQTKDIFTSLHQLSANLAAFSSHLNKPDNTINSLFTSNDLHENINQLLADFKDNPERYLKISVFGKETPEVKYKNKIQAAEMKKKWQEYQKAQKEE